MPQTLQLCLCRARLERTFGGFSSSTKLHHLYYIDYFSITYTCSLFSPPSLLTPSLSCISCQYSQVTSLLTCRLVFSPHKFTVSNASQRPLRKGYNNCLDPETPVTEPWTNDCTRHLLIQSPSRQASSNTHLPTAVSLPWFSPQHDQVLPDWTCTKPKCKTHLPSPPTVPFRLLALSSASPDAHCTLTPSIRGGARLLGFYVVCHVGVATIPVQPNLPSR